MASDPWVYLGKQRGDSLSAKKTCPGANHAGLIIRCTHSSRLFGGMRLVVMRILRMGWILLRGCTQVVSCSGH